MKKLKLYIKRWIGMHYFLKNFMIVADEIMSIKERLDSLEDKVKEINDDLETWKTKSFYETDRILSKIEDIEDV